MPNPRKRALERARTPPPYSVPNSLNRRFEHRDRPREDELGLPPAPHDALPDEQRERDRGELGPHRGPDPPCAAPALRERELELVEPALLLPQQRLASCQSSPAWRRTSSFSRSVISAACVATAGESMRRGRCVGRRELGDHMAGAARQQHDAVTESHRLAHVVGHEEDREAGLASRAVRARRAADRGCMASSAPNGSSMRSTSASCASARASATRWRMPPESSCGRFFANSLRLTSSSSSATRAAALLPSAPCAA